MSPAGSRRLCDPSSTATVASTLTWLLILWRRRPPSPTLFPYTTLFRSSAPRARARTTTKPFGPPPKGNAGTRQKAARLDRSEEHTSELQSRQYLVCRLLLEKKKNGNIDPETRSLTAHQPPLELGAVTIP